MRKPIVLLAAAAILAFVGNLRAADDAKPAEKHHHDHASDRAHANCEWQHGRLGKFVTGRVSAVVAFVRDLNLTEDQRHKVVDLVKTHRREIAAETLNLWRKRAVLRDAVLAEKTDEAAIRKAADDLGKAIGDAAVKSTFLKAKIAEILTPDQRKKVADFIQANDKAVEAFLSEAAGEK